MSRILCRVDTEQGESECVRVLHPSAPKRAQLQELSERRSRGARRAIQKIRSPIPFYKMSGIRAVRLR